MDECLLRINMLTVACKIAAGLSDDVPLHAMVNFFISYVSKKIPEYFFICILYVVTT